MSNSPMSLRWFRFSLRTLFVAVAVFGVALGWLGAQIQIVRHRQAMRKQIEADSGIVVIVFIGDFHWMNPPHFVTVRPADRGYKISGLRKSLGDQFVDLIGFNRQLTAADRRAIEAFPEAEIFAIP